MKLVLIILAVLLLSAASQARGSELAGIQFKEARAYFVGWSLLTRVPLGIDDVIEMKRIYIEVNDPGLTAVFVEWLRLSDMKKRKNKDPGDARLVIELIEETGDVITLYSDGSQLFSADSSRSKPVDEAFLDRFDLVRNSPGK